MRFKCPVCSEEMKLDESTEIHSCEACKVELTAEAAKSQFEEGQLVGIVDESEAESVAEGNEEDTVVASLDEDIAALAKVDESLSEEFLEKAKTIMESAITARVTAEVKKIEEQKAAEVETAVNEAREEIIEKVDTYLDHVVSVWMEENKVAVEAGIKSEMNESLIEGLGKLFAEHYLAVPEDRWDVVEGLASKIEDLETKLDESIESNMTTAKQLIESEKALAFIKISEGLAETQKEKLLAMSEGIEAKTAEEYSSKLETIKESYFGAGKNVEDTAEEEQVDESTVTPASDLVAGALAALRRRD